MSFGDGIRALLDTYANCVSLLKAFGRGREEEGAGDVQHRYSRLRKSLKSDRSLVEKAYSSRVSESGSRFRKGDARAVTALDRVLKRLKSAITNLLRLSSKKDGLDLDYQSLMSLSNGSRTEAIKAIDSLSRRLGSPSRSSVVSSSSTKASSKASSRHKPKSSSKPGSSSTRPAKEPRQDQPSKKKSHSAAKDSRGTSKEPRVDAERIRKNPQPVSPPPPQKSPDTKHLATATRTTSASPGASPRRPRSPKSAVPNRISILSFSSDSTKLGEIPQRKWQSVMQYSATDPDGNEYNVRPTFPLKPYTVEVKERRFFGLFSRKREA